MFETIANIFRIEDLRKKIFYTILLIIIFRLGSHVPVPGLSADALSGLVKNFDALNILDMISGGALSKATIFAMSITPYINSSIIMNLLTVAVPALERMARQGDEGRKKIGQYTRYLTVILAFIQSTGMYFGLRSSITNVGVMSYFTIILSFTAGTAFLMWLGEQINEKGVGNGISLIIFTGIVSRGPTMITNIYNYLIGGQLSWIFLVVFLAIAIAVVGFVVFMNDSERRIPVQYAKRVVGRKMYGGQSTHIPIKLSMAGVIPIIFALSIMTFPITIMQLFNYNPAAGSIGSWIIHNVFSQTSIFYNVLYFLLVLFFTFFYTKIQFNTIEISNNMKNNGGFVPGIRPGRPTSEFIEKILNKVTLAGAVFLGLIAVLPMLLSSAFGVGIAVGGTSLLIVVGVVLETGKQIEAQMMVRHYKGFLE